MALFTMGNAITIHQNSTIRLLQIYYVLQKML